MPLQSILHFNTSEIFRYVDSIFVEIEPSTVSVRVIGLLWFVVNPSVCVAKVEIVRQLDNIVSNDSST